MSFSGQVKQELNSIQKKSNCCKKAYLFGAILAGTNNQGEITLSVSEPSSVDEICYLLKTIYKTTPDIVNMKRGCLSFAKLSFKIAQLNGFIEFADNFSVTDLSEDQISEYLKCNNCRQAFLRAIFCASGSVSDPKRSYTLEIRLNNECRAELVRFVAESCGLIPPSITKRENGAGLFYRNEAGIEEFLTFCGANRTLFEFFDVHIEKDIRNAENRATNCVAKNISKSVEAISLQISAIEALKKFDMFDDLSRELKTTAALRLENQEATLTELAALHTPPISKSGLNHRLSKIIDEAQKRKLIK